MGLTGLIGRMARIKYEEARKAHASPPVRTPVPGGLHQGSAVDVSPAAYALVQGAGGVFVPPGSDEAIVTAVGVLELFGLTVHRSHLSDGKSFIESVSSEAMPAVAVERRLYVSYRVLEPRTDDDFAQLLGREVKFDERGRILEYSVDAIIGYSGFLLDLPDGGTATYQRTFDPGRHHIGPMEVNETIIGYDGAAGTARHRLMNYTRSLGDGPSAPCEHLLADLVTDPDGGTSYDVSIGIDLDPAMLTIHKA